MSEAPNVDLDELDRLVYNCINKFGPEERQRAALERIFDILTEHTDFAKNVVRCSVCGATGYPCHELKAARRTTTSARSATPRTWS